jgi:oxygen-dependent protoporphyrinogen oxidase
LHLDRVESIVVQKVILGIPSWAAGDLLQPMDDRLAALLRRIPHVSTATLSLAYDATAVPRPLDGFGFVVPRVERRRITACTWASTKLPDRAPEGSILVRCFIGRAGEEDWVGKSDEELVTVAREELAALMGISAPPRLTRVFRWIKRMPQYLVGHQELLRDIDRGLASHPGLLLTGSSYRGVGIPDCIRDAGEIAARFR